MIGAEGDLSDHLRYDVSFVYGRSTQKSTTTNARIADRYYAALDAVDDGTGNVTCRINLPGQTSFFSEKLRRRAVPAGHLRSCNLDIHADHVCSGRMRAAQHPGQRLSLAGSRCLGFGDASRTGSA
ncbi:hypothetical protein ACFSTD_06120 [Novosphingobium colocasiae]